MAWINEFHYDNVSTDAGEFIEIAGAAGTDLTGWSLVLYNGGTTPTAAANAIVAATIQLSGVIQNLANGFGTLSFAAAGLQNGSPDGFALVNAANQVVQFLSFEGVLTAGEGVAEGQTSVDIGISQAGSEPVGSSLHLIGTGDNYADFAWAATNDDTPGAVNGSQIFEASVDPSAPPVYSLSVSPAGTAEGESGIGNTTTFTVTRAGDTSQAGSVAVALSGTADGQTDYTVAGDLIDGRIAFAADSANATFTVTTAPDMDVEANETVIATISDAQDADGPFGSIGTAAATATITNDDFDETNTTLISAVQGTGAASTLIGQVATIEAIVVGDFQNGDADDSRNQGGFYLQQVDGDGDPLTSEGIFISEGSASFLTDVAIGDKVRVTGTVQESFGTTQIAATDVTVTGTAELTATQVDALAAQIDLPTTGTVDLGANGYAANLEQYEGMLVTLPEKLTITEQFNLDRFNEIRLFAADGFEQAGEEGTVTGERPFQFTQNNAPDAVAYDTYLQQVAAREIVYDDGLTSQNNSVNELDGFEPYSTATAPRMGDTVDNLTGVLRYDFNEYRVIATADGTNEFTRGNANPAPSSITAEGGSLKVASFNVLNFFTTLDNGSGNTAIGLQPRGANNTAEYERQLDKLVVAIDGLDADVVGLIEIENQFQTVGGKAPAVQALVDALNEAEGSDVWDYVDPGQPHIGGDAISVGAIYRTDTVRIADGTGPDGQAIALLTDASPEAQAVIADPSNGTDAIFAAGGGNRVPLAVTFEELATGEEITVAVNHFKSKGSASDATGDADAGDGAGASNQSRLNAAQALDAWLDNNPTGSATTNKLIVGDLNSYAAEEPIQQLLDSGFVNLAEAFLKDPYSYVFDGVIGTLDYMLASGEMFDDVATLVGKVEDFVIGNINADEADALDYNTDFGRDPAYFDGTSTARASDHDPLVASFSLGADQQPGNYTLQILHFSDAEASLLAPETAPLMAALVDAFEEDYANTLILAGGDNYIAGPFLSAGQNESLDAVIGNTAGGRPDIAIHNAIGVEVSALGNHEFDFGPDFLDNAITPDGAWSGALFPYVTSNLDFAGTSLNDNFVNTFANPDGLPEASTFAPGTIVPATVIEEGGERIGIIGATTQILERIANTGGVEVEGFPKTGQTGDGTTEVDDMQALAAYLQPFIDQMRDDGINKIVLTSHLQDIANEQELATLLDGVDVILAAGSNTRLGDANDVPRTGEDFQGSYPITVEDAAGGTTMIVNTDGQYKYLGRLAIEFDANGNIVPESNDPAVSGAYASTEQNVATAWNTTVENLDTTAFADGTKGAAVREITDAVQAVIDETNATVIGYTDVVLNGERNPGVRSEETNLGNITADASIAATRAALEASGEDATYVVALKNGGGIRAGIDAGEITQGEANAALAFDNRLMVFDATPQELLNILEFAADFPNNNGGFPQVGGLRFSYDEVTYPTGTIGLLSQENVANVALIGEDGTVTRLVENGEVVAGAPATIQVSVLNFTAQGGDGYPIKANGSNFRFVLKDGSLSDAVPETANFTDPSTLPDQSFIENSQGEQQAFADYLRANFGTEATAYSEADTPEAEDTRIQNVGLREDTVLDGAEQPPLDNVAPTFVTSTPADEASNVAAGADLVLTFSETVKAGAGDIIITNDTNPGDARTIDITDVNQVTFSGAAVAVDPTADLLAGGSYTVTFAAGTIEDLAGNDASALDGAGLNFDVATPINPPSGGGGTPPVTPPSTTPTTGPDTLTGTTGSDTQSGGLGNDSVAASAGSDNVFGNEGNDQVFGNEGADSVFGGKGNDSAFGGQGDDAVQGNLGNDSVEGNKGNDEVLGNQGSDTVLGNEGGDFVHGGQDNDFVHGGQGDDDVNGGLGNDTVNGGLGNDVLTGGAGSDVFVFAAGSGNDVVTDFDFAAGDRLDFGGRAYSLDTAADGSTEIVFANGGMITLSGVMQAEFSASFVA